MCLSPWGLVGCSQLIRCASLWFVSACCTPDTVHSMWLLQIDLHSRVFPVDTIVPPHPTCICLTFTPFHCPGELEEEMENPEMADLPEKQKHQLRHRELFLSRQLESLPATHIRYTVVHLTHIITVNYTFLVFLYKLFLVFVHLSALVSIFRRVNVILPFYWVTTKKGTSLELERYTDAEI